MGAGEKLSPVNFRNLYFSYKINFGNKREYLYTKKDDFFELKLVKRNLCRYHELENKEKTRRMQHSKEKNNELYDGTIATLKGSMHTCIVLLDLRIISGNICDYHGERPCSDLNT